MSLCPHGYTAFWDCPMCEEPLGTRPMEPPKEGEAGYRCPSCGNRYDSKMRTPADVVCFECRYPDVERE